MVDLTGFVKALRVPAGAVVPTELTYENLRARALSRADLADDVAGINASIDLIRRTRGGDWPTEPVTEAFDFVDLVWHEAEFREGYSFAYVLRDVGERYLGCCYLYPMGRRTPLTEQLLRHDVDVSWWVTTAGYASGYYETAYAALQHWLATALPFEAPYFSNREVPPPPDR